jgi:peptidoglycan hydrolase-like protein with peptidoglycan-binding domain
MSGGTSGSATGSAAAGGGDVREVQEQLKTAGFDPGPIDGVMGPQTQKALKEFQKSKGLEETGRVDQETRQALLSGGSGSSSGSTSGSGTGATGSGSGTTSGGTTSGGGTGATPGSGSSSSGTGGSK